MLDGFFGWHGCGFLGFGDGCGEGKVGGEMGLLVIKGGGGRGFFLILEFFLFLFTRDNERELFKSGFEKFLFGLDRLGEREVKIGRV